MKKTAIILGAIAALGVTACTPAAEDNGASDDTMPTDEPVVDQRTDEGEDSTSDDRTGPDDRVTSPDAPTGPDDRMTGE